MIVATKDELSKLLDTIPEGEARTIKITRELAEQIQQHYAPNRILRTGNIKKWYKKMISGKWGRTGQPILFTSKEYGYLLVDGKHRIEAFLLTGLDEIEFTIYVGTDPNHVTDIDEGLSRNLSDQAAMLGIQINTDLISGAVKIIAGVEKNRFGDVGGSSRVITKDEFIERLSADLIFWENLSVKSRVVSGKCKLMTPSMTMALMYLTENIDKSSSEFFFERYATGSNLEPGSPILLLREKLMKSALVAKHSKHSPDYLEQGQILKYFIVAWNKYRKNQTCKKLIIPEKKEDLKMI